MRDKIIYVDDEEQNLYLFEGTFELDFKILTYISAQKLLENRTILDEASILVSDMKMPEMSGMELIKEVKKDFKHLTTYILSAYPFEKEVKSMIEDGTVKKFFSKPFSTSELYQEFEEVLAMNE